MLKQVAMLSVVLNLCACSSPEEEQKRHAALAEKDHEECVSLGFSPKTEPYGHCRLKLKEIRAQKQTVDRYRFHPHVGIGIDRRW